MRTVVQRVSEASVSVDGKIAGRINNGLVILVGFGWEDAQKDVEALAQKIVSLRIFNDENGRMNISLKDSGGAILVVSQFTLYGDCRKGRRPDFTQAAPPEKALALYEAFIEYLKSLSIHVQTGIFAAKMDLSLTNDGPVTLILQ